MPRQKRRALSPSKAVRLVEILIAEGKIIARDIARYLEIDALEARLTALRGGGEAPAPRVTTKKAARLKTQSKRTISAKGRASYRLQGQYIAYFRQLPKSARAKYQKIAKAEGREKAIATLKKALGK